jgi:hypothetical protein
MSGFAEGPARAEYGPEFVSAVHSRTWEKLRDLVKEFGGEVRIGLLFVEEPRSPLERAAREYFLALDQAQQAVLREYDESIHGKKGGQ